MNHIAHTQFSRISFRNLFVTRTQRQWQQQHRLNRIRLKCASNKFPSIEFLFSIAFIPTAKLFIFLGKSAQNRKDVTEILK